MAELHFTVNIVVCNISLYIMILMSFETLLYYFWNNLFSKSKSQYL